MDLELVDANINTEALGKGKSADYINYYNKNVLGVHSYGTVVYKNIYPNIDWVIYTKDERLKYDFVVHPEADPSLIKFRIKWAQQLDLNPDGSYSMTCSMGRISEQKPVSFQEDKIVSTNFSIESQLVSFDIEDYVRSKTLRIDPSVVWSTYYGDTEIDYGMDVMVDSRGNIFMCGDTKSSTKIASGGHQNTYGGSYYDAYLVKFNDQGVRKWATYYGGTSEERATGVAVDSKGAVFLTGKTYSKTGIYANGYRSTLRGTSDAFLVKFSSLGTRQWGTYYGGGGLDDSESIVVDASDNVFIAGSSKTTRYAGYFVKFNSTGKYQFAKTLATQSFSTYGTAICLDISGNIFLGGYSYASSGIALKGHQNSLAGRSDAFLVKYDNQGKIIWGTYYGGSEVDDCTNLESDNDGNIYLMGSTVSTSAIASSGHQNTMGGDYDAFIVRFNNSGVRQWASCYGGEKRELAYDLGLDTSNNIYMFGRTGSSDNIASGGIQNTPGGGDESFLVKFDDKGKRIWGTYYGGKDLDHANGMFVDQSDNIFLTGSTKNANFYGRDGHQDKFGGNYDAFLVKISQCVADSGVAVIESCDSYKWIDGKTYTESTRQAWYTISSVAGCDSTVGLDLTINMSPRRSYKASSCGPFFVNGKTYNKTGVFEYTKTNSEKCDSIITLDLTVVTINKKISKSGAKLTSSQTTGSYQWLDCKDYSPIANQTQRSYTATRDGEYAVKLASGNCTDTSECVEVKLASLKEIGQSNIHIYPNPFNQAFNIHLQNSDEALIQIFNSKGKEVYREYISERNEIEADLSVGYYLIQVSSKSAIFRTQLIKVGGL